MKAPEKLYKYHTENSRRIEKALNNIESHLRKSIAAKDLDTEKVLLPLYIFLIGALAETRLNKIINEPNILLPENITKIITTKNHLNR